MPKAECILSKDLSKKTQNFHLWLISSPGKKRANESEGRFVNGQARVNESEGRIVNGQASIEGLSQH